MDIKSGWRTSEFWISITTIVLGICIIFGLFTSDDVSELIVVAEKLAGALMAIASVAGYSIARGTAKKNTINVNDIVALANKVNATTPIVNNEPNKEN